MLPAAPQILIYILRRDVRLSDNPIFYHASLYSPQSDRKSGELQTLNSREKENSLTVNYDTSRFTHLLPVYIFPANQIEVSGFLSSSAGVSPYPEARSYVARLWRTGPYRAKFLAEGVWDLKQRLESLRSKSGLEIRVGQVGAVINHMLEWYRGAEADGSSRGAVAGIWMTSEDSTEEKADEEDVRRLAKKNGIEFKAWIDEKYFIDDREVPYNAFELPDVYTTYRKKLEPLRSRPRPTLPTPSRLPPLPPAIPPQADPFEIPTDLVGLKASLLSPLNNDPSFGLTSPPQWPDDTKSAHSFIGGETAGLHRVSHLVNSGVISSYKSTRNGLLGLDFSTKLSAYLAQGHITARQVHWAMVDFEEGKGGGKSAKGYGEGENEGTAAVRFELLWRDYMRLCVRKFGSKLFHIEGIHNYADSDEHKENQSKRPPRKLWRQIEKNGHTNQDSAKVLEAFDRFRCGRTGIGLIDASNRELFLTGHTSNRARQNVASFLASYLGIDWRIGAEWYEFLLIDYDCGSNWGNWQYVVGVGNDPRQGRVFNPVKQALDYDAHGEYIRAWIPELRGLRLTKSVGQSKEIDQQRLMGLFQAWRINDFEKEYLGLSGLEWVDNPLIRIQFSVGRGKRGNGDGRGRGRGGWRGRRKGRDSKGLGTEEKVARVQSPSADCAQN
ncbi:cryptochrome [Lojkania enalia]|uniref:Cryptochrome DASH n=1 Tax=Lojkania enalia TaxID=147567 RepID=A0A9P4JX62_9PLEO|nr:cryptochrome [Didymosphaeria enalia]